jgi:hypothetical protein
MACIQCGLFRPNSSLVSPHDTPEMFSERVTRPKFWLCPYLRNGAWKLVVHLKRDEGMTEQKELDGNVGFLHTFLCFPSYQPCRYAYAASRHSHYQSHTGRYPSSTQLCIAFLRNGSPMFRVPEWQNSRVTCDVTTFLKTAITSAGHEWSTSRAWETG